jgi:hypothetical protein
MSEYDIEDAWAIAPAETAANLIEATVAARTNDIVARYVAPAMEAATTQRLTENAREAVGALYEKYPEARQFPEELSAALEADPGLVDSALGDAQLAADRMEALWIQRRQQFATDRDKCDWDAVRQAGSRSYSDTMRTW